MKSVNSTWLKSKDSSWIDSTWISTSEVDSTWIPNTLVCNEQVIVSRGAN